MAEHDDDPRLVVLTKEAVRASIDRLQGQRIHTFFAAYLHIRRQAALQERTEGIIPHIEDMATFLEMPGGPPGQPYFRPFWHRRRDARQEWINANLAGSYAPSSIRNVPLKVVQVGPNSTYTLPANHWRNAREHLLYGEAVPVYALAGFYLRNYAFTVSGEPEYVELSREFLRTFGYYWNPEEEEIESLFDPGWTIGSGEWFEDWELEESLDSKTEQ